MTDIVRALKYDASSDAARLCGDLLAEYLYEEILTLRAYSTRTVLIMPVPLHISRERERGYSQITRILTHLPTDMRDGTLARVVNGALIRTRYTPTQTHLSRSQRLTNVYDAFAVQDTEIVRNAHIYLIDDVTTTGATLVHAGTPLERAGARVVRIALARA
jgi:predicted amidophosphoribosyltransferase